MPIIRAEQHGRTRVITLNRPQARNALSVALIGAIRAALAEADADTGVDAIILTGADPAFCAGLDLRELGGTGANLEQVAAGEIPAGHPWRPLSKPVIGAINGPAITGGLELALACDFLIASERALFADTHARVGLMPAWGLSARLPAAVGAGYARRMSLSGMFVGAQEALRAGLVTEVVEHDRLLPATLAVAESIAENEPAGVRALLELSRRTQDHVLDPALRVEEVSAQASLAAFDPASVARLSDAVTARGRRAAGA